MGRDPGGAPGYDPEVFKLGDVVVLASGGPRMTVSDFRPDDLVATQWFAGDVLMSDAFFPRMLEHAE